MASTQTSFDVLQAEIPVWQREHARLLRRQANAGITRDTNRVNAVLVAMGNYHDWVPLDTVNAALVAAGFNELEPMILCGREGNIHEPVGRNRWLSLTWYKMESGRYEVVSYVS